MKVIQEVPLKVSPLVLDLLNQTESASPFISNFFSKENCLKAANQRQFSSENRTALVNSLKEQYSGFSIAEKVQTNVQSLNKENTFTIVTGHQICAAGGPLYLIYKLFSAIRIAEELNASQSENHFVPVYWMATEDHDIEEVRHFYWGSEKIDLATSFEGIAGELPTDEFLFWMNERKAEGKFNEIGLSSLFEKAYSKRNFAEATRYWVNELLGEFGLVCIDGNDERLKTMAQSLFEKEIQEQFVFSEVSKSNKSLEECGYSPNIQPREFNLFWLKEIGGRVERKRIDKDGAQFHTQDRDKVFTKDELLQITSSLSPNVLLRPLYQETILPNVVYIGGPSELGYWLQLKQAFQCANLQMPLLVHRISITVLRKRDIDFVSKNELNIVELYRDTLQEAQKKMLGKMNMKSFEKEAETTIESFGKLKEYIAGIDASLVGWVSAEEKKQLDQWNNIEQRIKKAMKSKEEVKFNQLEKFYSFIHPNNLPQERVYSLLYIAEIVGWKELLELLKELDPFKHSSTIAG